MPGRLRTLGSVIMGSASSIVALCLLAVLLCLAIFGPWLAPYPYAEFHIQNVLEPPSLQFLAGTDQFGRDQFSRVIWGARGTLVLATLSSLFGVALGVTVGMLAAFYRGFVDEFLMRAMDVLLALPSLLLAMLILTTIGTSPVYVVGAIAVVFMPRAARVVRGIALSLAASEFVDAAKVRGESGLYIAFAEMLPNALGPIIVEITIRFGYAILLASSLGFLGLGARPPMPDWGLMINESLPFLHQAPWLAIAPAIALSTAVVTANLLGDALQRTLAPSRREATR